MRQPRGVRWLSVALLVLAVSAIGSFFAPACDPYRPRSFVELDGWFCRCEADAARQLESIPFDLTAVAPTPDGGVLVGGRGLRMLRSNEGGTEWSAPQVQHAGSLEDAAAANDWFLALRVTAKNGTAITREGRLYRTSDGGAHWMQDTRFDDELAALKPLRSASIGKTTSFVAANGAAYEMTTSVVQTRTDDFFALLPANASTPAVSLEPDGNIDVDGTEYRFDRRPLAAFAAEKRIWVVTERRGGLFRTRDGGETWGFIRVQTETQLRAVAFDAKGNGWAVGNGGLVLRGRNFGERWTHHTREPFPVQPLERLSMLPAAFFAANVLTLLLMSIAWRSPSGRARFRTVGVAEEIASDRPLKNADNDALGFVRIARSVAELLRSRGTEPPLTIAINGPWGSGKTSLLELVKGLLPAAEFRVVHFNAWHHQREEHLLASLLKTIQSETVPQWWQPISFLLFRLRVLIFRLVRRPGRFVILFLLLIAVVVTGVVLYPLLPAKIREYPHLGAGAGALSVVTAVLAMTQPFHAKARDVLLRAADLSKLRSLEAHLSFRERFAAEFHDVTRALREEVVVMVDDLDRCQADSVMEILETINFLTGAGDCYFILALDLDTVREHVQRPSSTDPAYGEKYLEKLINIAISLAKPTSEQAIRIMLPVKANVAKAVPWRITRQHWIVAAALAAAIIMTILTLANLPLLPQLSGPAQTQTAPPPRSAKKPDVTRAAATTKLQRFSELTAVAQRELTRHSFASWWPVLFFAALIGGVALRLLSRIRPWFADSDAFRKALTIWADVVALDATPRSLKRFTNRVRYLAIRARIERAENAVLNALTDETLVAIAAIEHAAPDLVNADLFTTPIAHPDKSLRDALAAAHMEQENEFGPLVLSNLLPLYRELAHTKARPKPAPPPVSRSWTMRTPLLLLIPLVVFAFACQGEQAAEKEKALVPRITVDELAGRSFVGTMVLADGTKQGMRMHVKEVNADSAPLLFEYDLMEGMMTSRGTGTFSLENGDVWFRDDLQGLAERDSRNREMIVLRSSYQDVPRWRLEAVKPSKSEEQR